MIHKDKDILHDHICFETFTMITSCFDTITILVVLHPSHVDRSFTEHLTLHVDTILSDQSHTSISSSDTARAGTLSVILGVRSIQLIGLSCFGHFANQCLKNQ